MLTKQPTFSVILPVYNRASLIERSVWSVLNQDFVDFELVCINDGSEDQTAEILEKIAIQDSRIRVFHQENKGRCAARNRGMDVAQGQWICFLDSDDFYYTNHLSILAKSIEIHPQFRAHATTLVHDSQLTAKNRVNYLNQQELSLFHFIRSNPISLIQLAIHNTLQAHLRFHEDDLPIAEDWLFIRELTLHASIWKVDTPTVEVGEHAQRSMNTTGFAKIAYYTVKSSELFITRNQIRGSVRSQITSWAYILAGHIYLEADETQKAWRSFLAALQIKASFSNYSMYWLILKSIPYLIKNRSK